MAFLGDVQDIRSVPKREGRRKETIAGETGVSVSFRRVMRLVRLTGTHQ